MHARWVITIAIALVAGCAEPTPLIVETLTAGVIFGVVQNPLGQPLPHARMRALVTYEDVEIASSFGDLTDAAGRYHITVGTNNIPPQDVTIDLTASAPPGSGLLSRTVTGLRVHIEPWPIRDSLRVDFDLAR